MRMSQYFPVIIVLFIISACTSEVYPQLSNDSIYYRLFIENIPVDSIHVRDIKGSPISSLIPSYPIDTLSPTLMVVSEPVITYQKLEAKTYQRQLEVMVQFQDSISRRELLSFMDTVDQQALRIIRKSSSSELKGDDPTILGKWLKPSVIIFSGISIIFSLFYLRSN